MDIKTVLEFLFIPVTAGVVGYVTNALAIRMLFRPFQPKWYTLGWQGIIPRTRGILAERVAGVVGERLVTVEEINRALSSPDLREKLTALVHEAARTLQSGEGHELLEKKAEAFINGALAPLIRTSLEDPGICDVIDRAAGGAAGRVMMSLGSVPVRELERYLAPVADMLSSDEVRRRLHRGAAGVVRSAAHRLVYSGKSLSQLFKGSINPRKLAEAATTAVMPMVKDLFASPATAEALADVLIQYKHEQFDASVGDRMKLGLVNMFLYDEKITELAHEKLPEIGERISSDSSVRESVRRVIEVKISEFMNTPLSELAGKVGQERYFYFLHTVSEFVAARVVPQLPGEALLNVLRKNTDGSNESLSVLLERFGRFLHEFVPERIPLSSILRESNIEAGIKSGVKKLLSVAITLPDATLSWVSAVFVERASLILQSLMPGFLKLVDIKTLVAEKINSLDMKEVEDMLFAFMRDHFKWINILGFVIGFLVGLGQMVFIILRNS